MRVMLSLITQKGLTKRSSDIEEERPTADAQLRRGSKHDQGY